MAISLQTNVSSLSITSKLNKTSDVLGKSYNRLSTGLRITRPGDDPAGSQIADTLRAKSKIAAVAIQNANTALSFTSIADSALSGISDLFARAVEPELELQGSGRRAGEGRVYHG
jgi:flagellin